MNENTKKVLFIASVALNMVFAVTYLAFKAPSLAGVSHPPGLKGPIFHHLDLTPDQINQFTAERERFHCQLQELGQEIKAKQIEMIDLLGTASPDRQAIERKQEEILRLQGAVQDRVIVHFLQGSALLDPEQRSRFVQLIKERIETSVQACPPWMRPVDQARPSGDKNG